MRASLSKASRKGRETTIVPRRNGGVAGTGCFHSCKIVSRKQLAKDDLRRAALHTLNVEKTHDNQNGEVVR
jgi:hypothetical protein